MYVFRIYNPKTQKFLHSTKYLQDECGWTSTGILLRTKAGVRRVLDDIYSRDKKLYKHICVHMYFLGESHCQSFTTSQFSLLNSKSVP